MRSGMRRPSLATRIVDERARCHARQQGNVTGQIYFFTEVTSTVLSVEVAALLLAVLC